MDEIDFGAIEKKWQDRWAEKKVFWASETSIKEKFYVLEMFPYPSGTGLHMGHALNYTIGDILARFKRMKGFEVLHPMGFDALGLPAENAAIKAGTHPEDYTNLAIENFIKQQKALGVTYDWSRMVNSASPDYYKWDQWIFLKMLEKGLAYQKEASVNWCPRCNTVLANEQVNEGKCWRHEDTEVEVRKLRQWFFKTTEYADELLEGLGEIDWPHRTKKMQENWIGRSEGTEIGFRVFSRKSEVGSRKSGEDLGNVVILVDAVHCLVDEEGNVNQELKDYLDSLPNRKIVLTSAPMEKHELFFKNIKDYEVFTLEFNPGKDDPEYYRKVLDKFDLKAEDVVYFENKKKHVDSAISVGVDTLHYEGDIEAVKEFVNKKISTRTNTDDTDSESIKNKEFIFLHGYKFGMDDDFWKWLKGDIEAKGGRVVFNKSLPNRTEPNLEEQMKFVLDNCELNKNTVIVAHSLGAVLTMKLIPKLKDKIDKLLIVACPSSIKFHEDDSSETRRKINAYCDWDFDYDSVKDNASEIAMLVDENDSEARHESARETAEKLSISPKFVLANNKHFNSKEEPAVMGELIEPRTNADSRGHDEGSVWKVFTTRPDTVFGVTFMVVAAGHSRLGELVTDEQRESVDEYLKKMNSVSEKDIERGVKEGVFSGSYAVNPANGERVPIWVGNFVLADYGSGMVMGVPAHDKRDFEFAKKYGIEIRQVVVPSFLDKDNPPKKDAENTERNIIHAIVLNKEEDKIIALKNKKFPWLTPVTGGIKEGEMATEAAIREVKEETGYQNFELVKRMPYKMHAEFYAAHKNVNRSVLSNTFVFKLINEDKEPLSEEEAEKHDVEWIPVSDLDKLAPISELPEILKWFNENKQVHTDQGILFNSGEFNGMDNVEAKVKITDWLATRGIGKRVVNFKLRDWGVSRQRYWGTPIPVVYCGKCGAVPVPEEDLPVKLPKNVKFGEGNPLESADDWVLTSCPKCNGVARRETDTMDTFVNSSWYFLRYADPKNAEKIFDKEKVEYWNPVNVYIGGAEHACMHLLYSRFYVKFLRDIGMLSFDEPFSKLFHQGMLHAEDGRKMSKSLGNVVEPIKTMKKFGVDATRWFLVSVASPDKDFDWSEKGISGATRFIRKVFEFYRETKWKEKDSPELLSKLNLMLKNLEEYYGNFGYRKATIELRELFGEMEKGCSRETGGKFLRMIAPIAPHIAEELWLNMGNEEMISVSDWPEVDEGKILKKGEVDDLNGKIVERIKKIMNPETEKVYVYVMPFELMKVDAKVLCDKIGKEVVVFAVNDSEKVDPKGMAKRAKPGMAAIYLE